MWRNDINANVCFNSLWPGDAMWRRRSGSVLAHVMACNLMALSHDLNQCWPITESIVLWPSIEINFAARAQDINSSIVFENWASKMTTKYPRDQWVKQKQIQHVKFHYDVDLFFQILRKRYHHNPRGSLADRQHLQVWGRCPHDGRDHSRSQWKLQGEEAILEYQDLYHGSKYCHVINSHFMWRISWSLSSMWIDFNYLHHCSVEKWRKKEIYFYVFWN